MLTVTISINGQPIYTRTVVNTGYVAYVGPKSKKIRYICDDGSAIQHDPDDGAVKLAIKALETIKEVK